MDRNECLCLFMFVYLCSNHFKEACFNKSWVLQVQLFYTYPKKKEKKTCRWVYCCCNLDNENSAWGLGGGVSLPADPGQRPGGGLSF